MSTKLVKNNPKAGLLCAEISPNLRELEGLFVTHNPKVAGSNPAPATQKRSAVRGPYASTCWGLIRLAVDVAA